jgi:hypothetical protein
MTHVSDLERRLSSFYAAEAPARAPDWVLHRALDAISRTPQRRVLLRLPWRTPTMPAFAKLAAAVAAVAVVGLGLVALRVIPGPAAQPTPSPTVQPTPTVLPSATRFTSDLNAYSFLMPSYWRAVPATETWPAGVLLVDGDAKFLDVFISPGGFGPMFIASQPLTGDPSVWIRDQLLTAHSNMWPPISTCPAPFSSEITIDGISGQFDSSCKENGLRAFVRTGERGYAFYVRGDVPEQWFRDVLATVRLGDGG